jgi:hypothetical protein
MNDDKGSTVEDDGAEIPVDDYYDNQSYNTNTICDDIVTNANLLLQYAIDGQQPGTILNIFTSKRLDIQHTGKALPEAYKTHLKEKAQQECYTAHTKSLSQIKSAVALLENKPQYKTCYEKCSEYYNILNNTLANIAKTINNTQRLSQHNTTQHNTPEQSKTRTQLSMYKHISRVKTAKAKMKDRYPNQR